MTDSDEVRELIDPEVIDQRRPFYAYVVAAIGALFVLGGAFLVIMLIPTVLFPGIYESIAGLILMYVVGVPLAIIAAVLSFRATLRAYSKE